jgi:phage protein D
VTRLIASVAVVVTLASPVAAEEPTPLRWKDHEAIPARISDGLVAAQVTRRAIEAWRSERRGKALTCMAVENAVTIAATELLKRAFGRQRPDKSDFLSMPSGHTAMATVNGRSGWSYSLAVGVGWGRQAAGRHYATDVLAGAGIGMIAGQICRD